MTHEDYIKKRDEIAANPKFIELREYELSPALVDQGFTPNVYPILTVEGKQAIDALVLEVIGENQYSLRSLEKMVPTGRELSQNVLRREQRRTVQGDES